MKDVLSSVVDKIDLQIIELLVQNHDNKKISSTLRIPLSTIQRRVRKIIEKGIVSSNTRINYETLGFKTGLIHIYLNNGNLEKILEKISTIDSVISIEVHIGNSDILAGVVYNQGTDLLATITKIKKLEGVEKIVWSERILEYPIKNRVLITKLVLDALDLKRA